MMHPHSPYSIRKFRDEYDNIVLGLCKDGVVLPLQTDLEISDPLNKCATATVTVYIGDIEDGIYPLPKDNID